MGAVRHDLSDEEQQHFLVQRVRRNPSDLACTNWIRAGGLDYAVPLALFVLASIAVIVYNFIRMPFVPCDLNAHAKHFYCYNVSAAPGVHQDQHVG